MKINPSILGWLVAVCVSAGGLIISEIFFNMDQKPLINLLWPPTVRWVAWIVIGCVIGNLARIWALNRQNSK
jgi:hypothetical protein